MKKCPKCANNYNDEIDFCLEDGTPLATATAWQTNSDQLAPTVLGKSLNTLPNYGRQSEQNYQLSDQTLPSSSPQTMPPTQFEMFVPYQTFAQMLSEKTIIKLGETAFGLSNNQLEGLREINDDLSFAN